MAFSTDSPSAPRRFRRRSLVNYPKNMGAVVVLCSFTALALGPGLLNAYGVYEEEYDRLFDDKDETHKKGGFGSPVIFIGILQIFLANGMGFIGGQCAQRFGPGPSVFAGGLLMSLGLFTASYARHIWQLCLTQGLVFGLGVCLTWIPAASAPSSWFDKNRGLATGITHMGLGIGGLVFAPLTRFLLEKAGTAGSLRWLALVMIVGVTVASLGIHSKRHVQRISEVVVSSARWSKCLEDESQIMPENGYESDTGMDYATYRRSSILAAGRGKAMAEGDIETGKITPAASSSAEKTAEPVGSPKRVRFAPALERQKTLDKLEGLSRSNTLLDTGDQPSPGPTYNITVTTSTPAPKSVMRSPRFWLLSVGVGLGQAAWYIVLLFMTSISVAAGLDVSNAAIILGAINGASSVGQFAAGYAADLIGPVNSLVLFTLTATLSNLLLFIPNLSFRFLILYACLCGASIGASDPLAVIAGVTQFGRARAASTTGLVYGSVGMMVTVTAPNARVLLQKLGKGTDFVPVYVFVILLFAASTLFLVLLRLRISRSINTHV
ncbi:hypothetical protein LPJ53_004357 [Coemansia erecta]|uniref:MFS general substrate transporter n=1 Tax=Coemansia erecta TaxID=147472 RepID=A0A9W7XZ67_9FUNG|nr:hypothetical protein LPJ53_004357 [Coemansia erecta]